MPLSAPRVFISYDRHDSPEHEERVLRFAQRLRIDGIDAQIDRPTRWMPDLLNWAQFVLLICTETYYRRFRHEEPGTGGNWEEFIWSEMYRAKGHATKFVPVVFRSQDKEFVPERLSDKFYLLDSEEHYLELYRFLTGQVGVSLPELGPVKELAWKELEPPTFGGEDEKRSVLGELREGGSTPSDVFIAFKDLDEKGAPTRDAEIARDVYGFLTAKGLGVFFSPVTLENLGTWAYKQAIDEALDSAKVLVAIGTSADHLNSEWVRYEWDSSYSDILSGVKPNGKVFTYIEGMTTAALPRALRQTQTFFHLSESLQKLFNFIIKALPRS
jgi:hypothetical protein